MRVRTLFLRLVLLTCACVIANRAGAQTDIVISAETVRDFGKMSPANVEIVDDPDASNGLAIEFTGGANNPPIPEPTAWFEVEFKAEAAEYFVWMRGKSNGDTSTDADWFQFDDQIGTANHTADPNALARGIGNWRDVFPAGVWIWSSQEVPPPTIVTVKFAKAGLHKLKVQPRQVPHRIDQIWFSQDQDERPEDDPVDWDPAIDPRLDLAPIDGGGVPVGDPRPVDSRGKLTTTWGRLKQKP